jgi:Clostripain family
VADNNLEYYLRQDFEELTESAVINSPDLRTWIYYDALNQGGDPLPNTVDSSGNPLTTSYTGSRFITYDPSIQKMRVDLELSGEQNSDTPVEVQSFLEHALADCLANGYDSLFAIFSSHGGGFAGYGGDENSGRKLLQTNAQIASAIRGALDNAGGPSRLEVLGFDACLMQAVGAADDYKDVADYILASEAVEPGHGTLELGHGYDFGVFLTQLTPFKIAGWAYSFLTTATTALDMAKEILDTFLTETQGGTSHQSPKTMAILDTNKFNTFIGAFESFSADLLAELKAGDVSLHSFVSRARSSAVAFEGIVDAVGSQNPSSLDLGSWLYQFKELCNPGEPLQDDLDTAITTYEDMFVDQGVGPGTSAGTGIHITWPNQGEFSANKALWNQVLFNNANYVTQITPKFQEFLQWFLSSSTPSSGEGSEVPSDAAPPGKPDALIISDSGKANANAGTFEVRATISASVSQMLVEYGIDLSTPLKPVLEEKGYVPSDDDYLYLLGGDVAGTYQGSTFSADWNQQFYFLNISGTSQFEALYVFDMGDGSRKAPCMYFPEEHRQGVAELQFLEFLFFDFNGWIEKGARFGFLMFSEDEAVGRINDNLALFISNSAGVFAELPRSAGGLMIPLVYIDAYIQGRKLDTLPGGFNQTVISWDDKLDYNILTTPATRVFDVIPSIDAVVINMYAYNHGDPTAEPDSRYYDVERKRGQLPGGFQIQPDGSTEEEVTGDASGSTRLAASLAALAGLLVFISSGLN